MVARRPAGFATGGPPTISEAFAIVRRELNGVQIMSRAKRVFDKLCRVLNLDTQAAAAELNRRYGTAEPEKLSEKQINELFLDLRQGAYAMATGSAPTVRDELDEDDEDKLVPSTDGSRKADITSPQAVAEIYARFNRRKAGVKIVGQSPRDEDDDLDGPE